MRIDQLLADARRQLAVAPFAPSTREATLLLGHVLGEPEVRLLARGERRVSEAARGRFEGLLARRLTGEPVAYLTGLKEFYGRPFAVDARVLVPRPETEHLIEEALDLALPPSPRILDVGTGSGCLAITLAREIPGARVVATDLSPGALAVAAANVRRHGVSDRVRLAATDLCAGLLAEGFDLVVSNPPYVDPDEPALLAPEVGLHEPPEALFGGRHGLDLVERLLRSLAPLPPGKPVLLEIGHGQAARMKQRLAGSAFELVGLRPDYAGILRIARLRRR